MFASLLGSLLVLAGITYLPPVTGRDNFVLVAQGIAPCHQRCAPLLKSVKPTAEARHAYSNCRKQCDPPRKKVEPKPKKQPKAKPQRRGQEICVWSGTAPACSGQCVGGGKYPRAYSKTGDGARCITGTKVLCCQRVVNP